MIKPVFWKNNSSNKVEESSLPGKASINIYLKQNKRKNEYIKGIESIYIWNAVGNDLDKR